MQDQILDALRRGDTTAALDAARSYAIAEPDDAQAQRLLALALRGSGDADGARAAIERAISLAPDDAGLQLDLAGLLFGARDLDGAGRVLQATVVLDPNELQAYLMQAQLALGRGDLDEAARLLTLAARVSPEHPRLLALQGTLGLRRGRGEEAMKQLALAAKQAPDDPVVLHALGFAYLVQDHLAFAEQTFRRLLELAPGTHQVRLLVAQAQLRQGRPGDAADEVAALLAEPSAATPALRRHAGELELAAGRPERAIGQLREALAATPDEPRTLAAIGEAWRRLDDSSDARRTLDAALATRPGSDRLWRARLSFEPAETALEVIERWREHMPDSVVLIEAEMLVHAGLGRAADSEAAARRLLERVPGGHPRAEMGVIDALMVRDPREAAQRLEALIQRVGDGGDRSVLDAWLGLARHRAGDFESALDAWQQRHAANAASRLPLPVATAAPAQWPEPAAPQPGRPPAAFLVGLPGSQVERAAELLAAVPTFRDDRFTGRPPQDMFQDVSAWARLASGDVAPEAAIATWGSELMRRGIAGSVIDWLPWWDHAYVGPMRAALPEALVLVALRDPRDMLVEWLAFGSPTPFALESPQAAAEWLAPALEQLATLHEQALLPHRLLRLDDTASDAAALTAQLGEALGIILPEPPASALGAPAFSAGTWRDYAGLLAAPFAALAPVARRLGYPDA